MDQFKKNLNQIYQSVSSKNGKNISAGSLVTYKSRIIKIFNDFEKYGIDPTKMANWNPKVVIRRVSQKKVSAESDSKASIGKTVATPNDTNDFIFDFKGNIKLVIPKTDRTNEAVMDGALKDIRGVLKKFADEYGEDVQTVEGEGDQ